MRVEIMNLELFRFELERLASELEVTFGQKVLELSALIRKGSQISDVWLRIGSERKDERERSRNRCKSRNREGNGALVFQIVELFEELIELTHRDHSYVVLLGLSHFQGEFSRVIAEEGR